MIEQKKQKKKMLKDESLAALLMQDENRNTYLKDDQFEFVASRVKQARNSLKDQQEVIDKMEKQMRHVSKARKLADTAMRRVDDKQ